MKKILIIKDEEIPDGSPSVQRLKAFSDYFEKNEFIVINCARPKNIQGFFKLMRFIYKENITYILNSMPMFRTLWLLFLPRIKVIFDIRDGWSIAIKNGYGGTVKKRIFSSFIVKNIERFFIRYSHLTITCTFGLKNYLDSLSTKSVLLITNGSQFEIENFIRSPKKNDLKSFICTGKFSEYGIDKAKKVIDKINEMNNKSGYELKLVGANSSENKWVENYINETSSGNGTLVMIDRLVGKELMKELINSDCGVCVLRDPNYDFGTKVFDYIIFNLPVLNYFDEPNNFTDYFDYHLDRCFKEGQKVDAVRSRILQRSELKNYL